MLDQASDIKFLELLYFFLWDRVISLLRQWIFIKK